MIDSSDLKVWSSESSKRHLDACLLERQQCLRPLLDQNPWGEGPVVQVFQMQVQVSEAKPSGLNQRPLLP